MFLILIISITLIGGKVDLKMMPEVNITPKMNPELGSWDFTSYNYTLTTDKKIIKSVTLEIYPPYGETNADQPLLQKKRTWKDYQNRVVFILNENDTNDIYTNLTKKFPDFDFVNQTDRFFELWGYKFIINNGEYKSKMMWNPKIILWWYYPKLKGEKNEKRFAKFPEWNNTTMLTKLSIFTIENNIRITFWYKDKNSKKYTWGGKYDYYGPPYSWENVEFHTYQLNDTFWSDYEKKQTDIQLKVARLNMHDHM